MQLAVATRIDTQVDDPIDLLGSPLPAGWRVALRTVAGGVAVLSGPLTEPELVDLLDLVLAPR